MATDKSPANRVLAIAARVAVLVIVLLVCLPVYRSWRVDRDWRAVIAAMPESPLPMTLGQAVGPLPDADDDAAPLYHAAFAALTTADSPYAPGAAAGTARPELAVLATWLANPQRRESAEVRAILAEPSLRLAVTQAEQAGRRSGCHFPVDLTVGPARPQPHLPRTLDLATLILAAASDAGLRGDADACHTHLLSAAWLARHTLRQPSLDAVVAYDRQSAQLIATMVTAAERRWLEPRHLAILLIELQAHDSDVFIRRAAAAERLIMLGWLDRTLLAERRSEAPGQEPVPLTWMDMEAVHRDLLDWHDVVTRAETQLSEPCYLRRDTWPIHADRPAPRIAAATGVHVARLDAIARVADRARARAVVGRTAVAVYMHLRLRERLPTSLLALTPRFLDAVPVDPCTGLAPTYTLTDDGRFIGSPGPDGDAGTADDLGWLIHIDPITGRDDQ